MSWDGADGTTAFTLFLRQDHENHFMRTFTSSKSASALLLFTVHFALVSCSSDSSSGGVSPGDTAPDNTPLAVGSEAPGPDDEPIAEGSQFNTAVGFQVLRDPGARIPEKPEPVTFTDADFAAGPPPVVLQVPDGLDTATNQPPFFEGLSNVDVVAGDILEIVYFPQDAEGELPGMFPEKLPRGSEFADNFDGSKVFRWQPLQMDEGILRFTVTALDPANSAYRASYSVLIRVSLPDDPSLIPNVAPMLDEVIPHTARVGDPVVFELRGIDLNGSVPTLELPDPPAGATFEQHPRFDEIFVLRFVPQLSGEISMDVVVRDSVDTSLFSTTPVGLTVLEAADFERDGQALRTLAANRNIQIGFAALQNFYHRPDGAIYADVAAREYDIVTPENSMKMEKLNPESGRYEFADTDNLMSFARANDMSVRGHTLVWHRQLPAWIESSAVDSRETHMREYIARIMDRYSDDIAIWDVVNEPVADDGSLRGSESASDSVWFEAMGPEYIDIALLAARDASPTATLLINEFDISMAGPKFDGLMNLVDDLQQRQIPLDGIGFQMHLFTSFDTFDELRNNFAAVAERGLDIYITELDVSLADGASTEDQAASYRQIVSICLEQPRCKAVQTWGITDQYSFRSIFDPLPFDRAYQAKPAYRAIQEALVGG